ncbi:HlyD family efflux transporter periplasmic adaptor subunit [Geminocystis herdmanii]|uniref:HlyD family efflux transporter periplasmic adaptor subunit n=1 Tax=Geminocystis herdmanii TaxID=669359 RepID=UPI000346BDFB|nr:HlyD family efflux transporter periplasmic adaptor subunit [Geminocystis herdmanii]
MSENTSVFRDNGKKWVIISTVLGIVTLISTTVYFLQKGSFQAQPDTPIVEKASITAISALGRIEPQGEIIKVAANPSMSGAKVKSLMVLEGSMVKKGDIIAITSDYDTKKAELNSAQKDLEVAQANLAIIKAGAKEGEINAQKSTIERLNAQLTAQKEVDRAKITRLQAQLVAEKKERQATIERVQAELNNAQSELSRYQELVKEGVISQSDFETRQLTVETTKKRYQESEGSYQKTVTTITEEIREIEALALQNVNTLTKQVKEAEARLEEISEIRKVDVAKAEAEVQKALSMVNQATVELNLTQIKAPNDGQVIDIKAYEGETIDNAEGVIEMANTKQMLIIAEVYESDISKLKLGQKAIIKSENNSFPDSITGNVVHISSKIGKKDVLETDPAASVDARVVEVKIAVNPQDNNIINNLIYSQVLVQILL